MWRRRWHLPSGILDRTRLIAAGIASLAVGSQLSQVDNNLRSEGYLRLSYFSVFALLAIMIMTYLRRRASWWTVPLVPVLVVLAGSGLADSVAAVSFALGSSIVLSLYGSMRMWVARIVGACVAVPLAVAVSPASGGRDIAWNSPTVINLIPQIMLMAVLTRGIYLALIRQERAARREAALARAGHAMIGVTDIEAVREVGRRTAAELIELSPGTALMVIRRDDAGDYRITVVAGANTEIRGRRLAAETLREPGQYVAALPEFPHWQIDALGINPAEAEVLIAVGGRRTVRADVFDAFRTLSHQVVLAEQTCKVYAELDHLAHHDHLTQLPTRAKFFRTLQAALASGPAGSVALLNVDLDDFKQVNDRYGHAAGDELLVGLSSRMAEVAHGRGLAGRFGGDEFALLLTGLSGPEEASRVAARLSARLAEPVRLTAATVAVGASIGIASAEPGITLAELTRRADVAMYAAKAAGKNRVEIFQRPGHLVA